MSRLAKTKMMISSAVLNAHIAWWRTSPTYRFIVSKLENSNNLTQGGSEQ